MTKIVNLKSENVKRIEAVEINPDGSLVVIGGNNAQGKSSVLDSIFYALAGGKAIPAKALRDGEDIGQITVELDSGLKVTRKLSKNGKTTLKVENAEGAVYKSPQTILDKMCGQIGFDPLKFTMLSEKEQATTLRELLGIDFTELDNEREEVFNERTNINREIKSLQARYGAIESFPDLPETELSVVALVDKREEMRASIQYKDNLMKLVDRLEQEGFTLEDTIAKLEDKLLGLRTELETINEQRVQAKINYNNAIVPSEDELNEINDQIDNAEDTNRKIRSNQMAYELFSSIVDQKNTADVLTNRLSAIESEKKQALEAADFPIQGLSFDENGVIYQGIPLSQASSAEKLKVSVSIGIAMNPELKVILIRDGSLLDDSSMEIISEMAKQHDMQIWIERVGHGSECSVIIEDGKVAAKECME